MSDRIRIITDCDGLRTPHPDGERLYRFDAGSELALLEDYDLQFFRAAYEGQLVFVPKTCCYRLRAASDEPPIAMAAPAAGGTARPTASISYGERSRSTKRSPGWVKALRVLAFLAGAGMVLSGVILIFFAAPSVLSSEDDVSTGYVLGITGGVILAVGLGLVRLSQRALLQFALLFTGVVLAISGIELLIFAIPISRMRHGDIDPDRALPAMLAAGAVLLPLGLAIAAVAVVRWLRNPYSRQRLPDVARWSAIIFGGFLLLAGTSVAGTIPAASEDFTADPLDAAAVGIAVTMFLVPGAILCFHGLTMTRPRLNGPFRFFPATLMFALVAAAIALGAIVVAVEEPIVWLMTSAHAGAALLPALALIALASRGGFRMTPVVAGISHRQLWLALAVGIAVVTTVAGTLDSLIAQAFSTAVLASSGAFDGLRTFEAVTDAMQFPDLYLSRWQSALLLLTVVAVVAPVMEEGFKAIGVSLILPRLPTPSAALTLGVAVGAGFGVTEASLYGLGGLQVDSDIDWWALMLLRAGATTMHALNTGLLGLALYFGAAERRYRRGFALYLAAVALHGLWNTLAVLAGSRVIFEFESLSEREISLLAFGAFAALGLAMLAILYVVVRRAYQASPKLDPRESPPMAPVGQPAFEPWIGV